MDRTRQLWCRGVGPGRSGGSSNDTQCCRNLGGWGIYSSHRSRSAPMCRLFAILTRREISREDDATTPDAISEEPRLTKQEDFPMMRSAYLAGLLAAGGLTLASPSWSATPPGIRRPLKTGWRLQSSAKVLETGAALSMPGYRPEGWHPAPVPGTVLAALVENKVYPDPYFGSNLRSIPGTGYPVGQNFSNLPMPADSPFRPSWWYRTEFEVPAARAGRTLWLHFDGIHYRANVWMNGQLV